MAKKSLDERILEFKASQEKKSLGLPASSIYHNVENRRARIELLQKRMGLSQVEMARRLGTSPQYYWLILRGRKTVSMSLLKLAELLYKTFTQAQRNRKKKKQKN